MATRLAVLKDGILQQVGTPEEVYFRPDNVFVAGFIGSPSMNFVHGRIVGTPDEMSIEFPAFRLRLPVERAARLRDHIGAEIICGIRPEDIHDRAFIRPKVRGQSIEGLIGVTEMMGNERFLYVLVGDERLLARVDSRTAARAGQRVQLLLDVDRRQIFSAATGLALARIDLPGTVDGVPPPAVAAEYLRGSAPRSALFPSSRSSRSRFAVAAARGFRRRLHIGAVCGRQPSRPQ